MQHTKMQHANATLYSRTMAAKERNQLPQTHNATRHGKQTYMPVGWALPPIQQDKPAVVKPDMLERKHDLSSKSTLSLLYEHVHCCAIHTGCPCLPMPSLAAVQL